MLNDAMISQSKRTEERLVRIENVLATMTRNIGRMASRININCVYYGGQDTFGKYKTIRCLRDDRIEDGCSMTLDQCLSCTRYEPILGQIYEILDSTGMNGAFITDDEQMSYNNAINFNSIKQLDPTRKFANLTNEDDNKKYKDLISTWGEEDRTKFIEELKKKYSGEELNKKIEELKEHEYLFKMDWDLSSLELQEPDVKRYPLEGIKAKYKVKQEGEMSKEDFLRSITEEFDRDSNIDKIEEEIKNHLLKTKTKDKDKEEDTDKKEDNHVTPSDDAINKDKENYDKLVAGQWVDTREEADSYQINKYTSEEFYFEGFGTNYNDGATTTNALGKSSNEIRQKIVDTANKIVQDHKDGKACYNTPSPRCLKYSEKDLSSNKIMVPDINPTEPVTAYDCSSFVSSCYNEAGLIDFTMTNTDGILKMVKAGGEMWEVTDEESYKKALPGDVILKGTGKGSSFDPDHTGIYMGDKKMAHASMRHKGKKDKDIVISDVYWANDKKTAYFCRSKELIALDNTISEGSGQFMWPTSSKRVTSVFGARRGTSRRHMGVDIAATKPGVPGEKIVAADAGTVTYAAPMGSYGNLVKIDHGNGYETRYAHNKSIIVNKGDKVTKGQQISVMGNTGGGLSTGVHLHFEIRKNGKEEDPLPHFDKSQYTIISRGDI